VEHQAVDHKVGRIRAHVLDVLEESGPMAKVGKVVLNDGHSNHLQVARLEPVPMEVAPGLEAAYLESAPMETVMAGLLAVEHPCHVACLLMVDSPCHVAWPMMVDSPIHVGHCRLDAMMAMVDKDPPLVPAAVPYESHSCCID
jgi:hypothetical protein